MNRKKKIHSIKSTPTGYERAANRTLDDRVIVFPPTRSGNKELHNVVFTREAMSIFVVVDKQPVQIFARTEDFLV